MAGADVSSIHLAIVKSCPLPRGPQQPLIGVRLIRIPFGEVLALRWAGSLRDSNRSKAELLAPSSWGVLRHIWARGFGKIGVLRIGQTIQSGRRHNNRPLGVPLRLSCFAAGSSGGDSPCARRIMSLCRRLIWSGACGWQTFFANLVPFSGERNLVRCARLQKGCFVGRLLLSLGFAWQGPFHCHAGVFSAGLR